jgi:hypothetical protein
MSSEQNGDGGINQQADFAQVRGFGCVQVVGSLTVSQAFKDLARGERAAAALENHLNSLEKKIEELLAKADEEDRKFEAEAPSKKTDNKAPTDEQSKDSA